MDGMVWHGMVWYGLVCNVCVYMYIYIHMYLSIYIFYYYPAVYRDVCVISYVQTILINTSQSSQFPMSLKVLWYVGARPRSTPVEYKPS